MTHTGAELQMIASATGLDPVARELACELLAARTIIAELAATLAVEAEFHRSMIALANSKEVSKVVSRRIYSLMPRMDETDAALAHALR